MCEWDTINTGFETKTLLIELIFFSVSPTKGYLGFKLVLRKILLHMSYLHVGCTLNTKYRYELKTSQRQNQKILLKNENIKLHRKQIWLGFVLLLRNTYSEHIQF